MRASDLVPGTRVGRLTVVGAAGRDKWYGLLLDCLCSCGSRKVIAANSVRRGLTNSCGCFQREATGDRFRTHGMRGDSTYAVWNQMIQRCTNEALKSYASYGGRGVRVSAEWLTDYAAFLRDVGRRPSRQHTLDRVDNDGNYELGNVRWATKREQAVNRRTTHFVTIGGVTKCLKDWERESGVSRSTIRRRKAMGIEESRWLAAGRIS